MANPKVAWGIDIGNRALKAVKLVRAGEGVRIDDIDVIEHENILSNAGDNREQLIQTALAVFTGRHQLKGNPAAIGVSGQSSFARFIKLPPVEEKKIPEIVRFEAIQQIPFPLDEVEWSYHLFKDEASPDVEVGIFAMKKDVVSQHLAYFAGTGVNIQAVQMNPLAVYNALHYDQKFQGATMVIDLGAENADLIIAEGEAVWMRSIPIGGNHFTEALVRDFKLRFERAEELKRTTATSPHGRRILQAMRPVFADLVSEIQRSIGFYSSTHRDSRITKVIALGGTFKLPGLQKYLQQNLGLDVVKLDGLGQEPPADAKVAAALSENLLSAGGAYGLALQAMGMAKITSSLLPGAIRKERVWREKTKWFAAAAACVVVGAVIPFVKLDRAQAAFAATEKTQKEAKATIASATALSDQYKVVEGAGGEQRKQIAEAQSLADYRDTWPRLLAELGRAVPIVPPANRVAKATIAKATAGTRPATTAPAADRKTRKDITFDEMGVRYFASATEMKAAFDAGSIQERDATSALAQFGGSAGGAGAGAGGVPAGMLPPGGGGTLLPPGGGLAPGGYPQPGAVPGAVPGAPAAPGGHRGLLFTIYLTTPNQNGQSFVQEQVAQKLIAQGQEWSRAGKALKDAGKALEAHRRYPFVIVDAKVQQAVMVELDAGLTAHYAARAAAARERKSAIGRSLGGAAAVAPGGGYVPPPPGGFTPGGVGGLGVWPPPAPPVGGRNPVPPPGTGVGTGIGAGVGAGLPVGVSGQQQADLDELLVDPVTGESIKRDYSVVVLVAVEIDPFNEPAPAPAAEAPPADAPPG